MQNKLALASLAMDLKRAALGYYRKSYHMADRFTTEALRWKNQINMQLLKPYMKEIILKLDQVLQDSDMDRKAEDILMRSTQIQNYVLKELF